MAKVCRGVKEYNQWGRERKKNGTKKQPKEKKSQQNEKTKPNKMKKRNQTINKKI